MLEKIYSSFYKGQAASIKWSVSVSVCVAADVLACVPLVAR